MPDPTDIVKRLRANLDKYPGFVNLNADAATAIETLLAQRAVLVKEVEAGRKMNEHNYTDDPDSPNCLEGGRLVDAYEHARAATDAAFKGGLPK